MTTEAKTTTRATKAKDPGPAENLNIYQRIAAISAESGALAPEAKGGVPFAFRGIDGTVAHLTPFLNKYGVFLAPQVQSHIVTPNMVGNRTVKTSEVEVTYVVYGPDGKSDIEVTVPGLADDFADRSSAQAMSVAYRIALLQLFHLPTHSKEPEETGQDVANAATTQAPRGPKAVETAKATPAPAGNIVKLQSEAKALGKALGKEPEQLNALAQELKGDIEDWFNSPVVMKKIVETLEAEQKQAAE